MPARKYIVFMVQQLSVCTWLVIDALQAPIVYGDENKALAEVLRKKYCGEGGEAQSKNKKRKSSESMNPTPGGAPSTNVC